MGNKKKYNLLRNTVVIHIAVTKYVYGLIRRISVETNLVYYFMYLIYYFLLSFIEQICKIELTNINTK